MVSSIEGFHISPQQRRLWLLQQKGPVSNAQCAVAVAGILDEGVLVETLRKIVVTHEILRTTFHRALGLKLPLQVISEEAEVGWRNIDLTGSSGCDQAALIDDVFQQDASFHFDYAEAPVVRASLIRLSQTRHVLIISMPSLCADTRTVQNLVAEISRKYGAGVEDVSEPEEVVQYVQFSEWQNELLASAAADEASGNSSTKGLFDSAALTFSFEKSPDGSATAAAHTIALDLGAELTARIKRIAEAHEASTQAFFLASWQTLLYRLSGSREVVVYKQFDGRIDDELGQAFGVFARSLPIHSRFDEDLEFTKVLKKVHRAVSKAREDQKYLWGDFAPEAGPEPSPEDSQQPIGFEFVEWPQTYRNNGLTFSLDKQRLCLDQYKVTLACILRGESLTIELHYNPALFHADDVSRMAGQLHSLIEGATARPGARVSMLPVLSESERRQLIDDLNDTVTDYPAQICFHKLFEQQAAATPEKSAVRFEDDELTYAELDERANRLAHYLRRAGVGADVPVGLCLERSFDMVISMLAVLKAGGAYVPLEISYPEKQLAFMIEDTGLDVLLTHSSLAGRIPESSARIVCLDTQWPAISLETPLAPQTGVSLENIAYVIYTSGSTGTPKGVMIPHKGLVNYLSWCSKAYDVRGGAGALVHSPIGFDLTITGLFSPLIAGRCVTLVREDETLQSFADAVGTGTDFSLIKITPSHLELLGAWLSPAEAAGRTRAFIIGGEALFAEDLSFWRAHAPETKVVNEYGPTETVVGCCVYEMLAGDCVSGAIPIGRPIANTQIYLLDSHYQVVPTGVIGELYIGGEGLARGYLNRPDLTAERFIPNPFSESGGERLYKTGDLARYLADGNIDYVGRADQQVKIKGYRIEPGEIEAALTGHEFVRQACVIAAEDSAGEKRLVAYVTVGAAMPAPGELASYLRERLPEHMVPPVIMVIEEMPLTPNGKIDRRALPDPTSSRPETDYVAPRTTTEEVLAAAWAKALGLDEVGVNDNFFSLGGDSIRSVRAVSLARERGLGFSVQDLYRHQTIGDLARHIEAGESGPRDQVSTEPFSLLTEKDRRLLPGGLDDAYPLTMLQAGMIYHFEMAPDAPTYHNVNSYHLMGMSFDRGAFERAIETVMARHPVLRTSFALSGYGEPLQLVHAHVLAPIEVIDVRRLAEEERDAAVTKIVDSELVRPFDLSRAPMVRFHIVIRTDESFQFIFTEFHAISDGWSTTSMFAEIFYAYKALLGGGSPPVEPAPATSFRDFVFLERAALESKESQDYWRSLLDSFTPVRVPRWPASAHPAAASRYKQKHHRVDFPISAEVFEGLKQLSRLAVVPLKSVFLAAHLKVMSMLSGQRRVLTGLHTHGRPEVVGGDRVRGLFLNTPPFGVELKGGTWVDLVQDTFNAERELLPHQRYPMAALQKERGPQPISEVLFGFLNFHTWDPIIQDENIGVDMGTSVDLGDTNFTLMNIFHLGPFPKSFPYPAITILEFDTEQLCEEQISLINGYVERVLAAMATDPLSRYDSVSFLSEQEQRQIIDEWNQTATDYPRDHSIHELFDLQAEKSPEAIAVASEGERLTYRELASRANQLANHLTAAGVGPESAVGIFLERSIETIVSMLAVLKAGGAYVPIDTGYPAERVKFILDDAGVRVLITRESLLASLPQYEGAAVCLDTDRELLIGSRDDAPPSRVVPDALAYIMYTSGSTGVPKGVCVPHKAVNRLVLNTDYVQLGESDVIGQVANISFDAATFEVWGALLTGARVVVIPKEVVLSGRGFADSIKEQGVTTMFLTTALFNQMAGEVKGAFSSMTNLLVGGDAVDPRWARDVLENGPPKRLLNGYGPTESTTFAVCGVISEDTEHSHNVPIGRPIANTTAYILDEDMQPAPVGATGELYIGGDGLARGYLNRPDITAGKFVPNPFSTSPGERLYRTGDLTRRLPDGKIEFIGRIDNQVKIRGFRIEPEEVEVVLSRHALVQDAVVVGRGDGRGEKSLIAYVKGDDAIRPGVGELAKFLKERLPNYMVPSAIVVMNDWPLTPNGKIDRRALPEPDADDRETGEYLAARTPVEQMLMEIWSDVLGVRRMSVHDNFFDLGGHSLLATRAISRIRHAFGLDVPLKSIFERPTASELAEMIEELLRGERGAAQAPAMKRANREGQLPLSYAQQRLWFIEQLEPGNSMFNIATAVRMHGELDIAALDWSLNQIVARHEALRTRFIVEDGRPVQVIEESMPVGIKLIDLSNQPEDEARIKEIAEREAQRPMQLSEGNLLRVVVMRLGPREHVAVMIMHHIVSDGWSMGLLIKELAHLYRNYMQGGRAALEPIEIQYADFAAWQRDWMKGEVLEREVRYWSERLASAPPLLELPTDFPRPAVQSHRGALEVIRLPEGLSRSLKQLSRQEGVTLFMTLLAGLNALLHRYTSREDILVGSPIANRNRVEIENLIGFFVNTLVLRNDLSGDPSFRELLARVRESVLDAYMHQDVPFEKLVEELQPQRSLSYSPLFQVMLVLQNAPQEELELPGLQLSWVETEGHTSKYDLLFSLTETDDGLEGTLQYSTDLFKTTTVKRMLKHFETLLESATARPDARLSELGLLTEDELRTLIVNWNQTAAQYNLDTCFHLAFEAQARKSPDALAVECAGERLTYGELDGRANRLARFLKGFGVGPEIPVGLCVDRSLDTVVGFLGTLKAGGVYLPLDPATSVERLRMIISDSRAPVVLTRSDIAAGLSLEDARVISLDGESAEIAKESESGLPAETTPDNLAYIIYTSGTTGRPKGVMINHRSLMNLAEALRESVYSAVGGRPLRVSMNGPAWFDTSVKQMAQLLYGHALYIIPERVRADGFALTRLLRDKKIDVLDCTPSHLDMMISAGLLSQGEQGPGVVLVGGEAINESLWATLANSERTAFYNVYGPTECTVDASLCRIDKTHPVPTIGRPLGNVSAFVLDKNRQPVPIGVPGELHIGGAGVARGYVNDPQFSAQKFIPNPYARAGRQLMYRTGDLVRYLDDGNIEFLGRVDNQVKIRGFRIEPAEIEATIRRLTLCDEVAVVAREDVPGNKRLVAYIVASDDSVFMVDDPRSHFKSELPDYMIPSAFVRLDALPLTRNGKLDRDALPPPEDDRAQPELPRNPVEEMLAEIWAEVMGLDRVGVSDNFFEIGGHSLLATLAISRVNAAFKINLPVRSLFDEPTVAGMARLLEAELGKSHGRQAPALEPVSRERDLPLSFAQQRLWFLDQLEPGNVSYNIPDGLRLEGRLDVRALTESLNTILQRHEALRTTFKSVDGVPTQIIAPVQVIALPLIDLGDLSEGSREQEAHRLAYEEARRPFNLATGPLVRATLIRLSREQHVLLLTMHHIISDGWSKGLLVKELTELYDAYLNGRPYRLPKLQAQYADYAVWQRQWLEGEVLDSQVDYWKEQLGGSLPVLELPTDYTRPATRKYSGASKEVAIAAEVTNQLRALCREEGATVFMALLAAYKLLLSRYSQQQEIVVGTPIAGRNRPEIENLIGFFVNTLALRTDLSGDPSFRELLGRVRAAALGAYTNQDLPFEKLVEVLQPERSMNRAPLFQAMFHLQNIPPHDLELKGLSLSPLEVRIGITRIDLELHLSDSPQGLSGFLIYSTELFEGATIERMIEHFRRLIESAVANPDDPISALSMMTEAERRHLLVEWNDTSRDYPRQKSVVRLFEQQVEERPDNVAVVFGDESLTYRELNARANQLAHYLISMGVGPEVLVGLSVDRSVQLIIGLLAILKAGAAYVPLDPSYPTDRLAFMLGDAQVPVLLTKEELADELPTYFGQLVCLDSDSHLFSGLSAKNPAAETSPANTAYVIYTSGSTGVPKGVQVSHGGLTNMAEAQVRTFGIAPDSRIVQFASLSFDASIFEIVMALRSGAALILARQESLMPGPDMLRLLNDNAVTNITITPSALMALPEEELPSLKTVIVAGEACPAELVARWARGRRFFNAYGPTEATVWSTVAECTDGGKRPTIGGPIDNTQIYILDTSLRPVPVGVAGELHIGGVGLARGYLRRPDITAEKFIPNPYSDEPGARLYKSGDLARYSKDGRIEFLGRIDHQVKVRGFRIELAEIEAVLLQQPDVLDVAVIAREDEPGVKRLVAYLEVDAESAPSIDRLRDVLKQKLPDYMTPSAFVFLESLPQTPNGKIDRRALPAPGSARPGLGESFVAPQTEAEKSLARIWSEVLGIDSPGIHDNFFALGGDSIRSVQVLSRAQEHGLSFSLQDIFQHQTIHELAGAAGEAVARRAADPQGLAFSLISEQDRVKLPEGVEDAYPLTNLQEGMIFLTESNPDTAIYISVSSFLIEARFDLGALQAALRQMTERHAVLRTSVDLASFSRPLQLVHESATVPVKVDDLRGMSAERQDEAVAEWIRVERLTRFDYERAPLVRLHVHLLGDERFQFTFTAHHSMFDGWSDVLFLSELFKSYANLISGLDQPQAAPPAASFRDYVALEMEAVDSEASRRYWRQTLEGSTFTRLPRWTAADTPSAPQIRKFEVPISGEVSIALGDLTRSSAIPLKSILLAAHIRVLSLLSGRTDVMTGLVTNGRPEGVDAENIIGLFLNTLPVRVNFKGGSWVDLAREVFGVERDFLPHRRYPLAQIQIEQGGKPLTETCFNFTHFHAAQGLEEARDMEVVGRDSVAETNFTLLTDFNLDSRSSQLHLRLDYDASRLPVEQVAEIAGLYTCVLSAITRDPFARYDEQLFQQAGRRLAEREEVLHVYPQDYCIHTLIEAQAKRTPDAVALLFEGQELTYAELNQKANQLANYLISVGVGPEARVGICADRSIKMVVGLLGILKSGAAYVPLDPDYPAARLAFMLNDARAEVLLTEEALTSSLPESKRLTVCLDSDWDKIAEQSAETPLVRVGAANLAYVIYTSGTTGQPKGVAIQHDSVVAMLGWAARAYRTEDFAGVLASTSICFDLSAFELFAPLSVGGRVILARNLLQLPELAAADEVTLINTVPSVLSELIRTSSLPPKTRTVNLAGEALHRPLVEMVYDQARVERVYNLYGPTEDTTYSTCALVERGANGVPPIGSAIRDTRAYVLDAHMSSSPTGVAGEVYLSGSGLARGYLDRPDLTAERFLPDPFANDPGSRMYRTGDIARYLPDGELEFIGRLDRQVKSRGHRIELGEIEAALRDHPAIEQAATVVAENETGDNNIVAYLAWRNGGAPTARDLRNFLRAKLPEFMMPARFAEVAALPLTPNGKVDYSALAMIGGAGLAEESYLAPRDDLETRVAGIWEEVLERRPLGVRDNFFDLGGHSLLAIRLMARIRQETQRVLPLGSLHKFPTIELLSEALRREPEHRAASPLIRLQKGGSKRPIFFVHPVGGGVSSYVELARSLGADQPFYAFQSRGIDGQQDPRLSIEDMAEDYLRAMRAAQPEGPYLLGGWSMGGVVAYEMARQLHAQGEKTSLLFAVDASIPTLEDRASTEPPGDDYLLIKFAMNMGFSVDEIVSENEPVGPINRAEGLEYILARAKSANRVPANLELPALLNLFNVFVSNENAMRNYRPEASPVKAIVVKAADNAESAGRRMKRAWASLALGGIDFHEAPGDHFSVLREAGVRVLAELLEQRLEGGEGREG
jgi:amino acid adenylation domain-containing protein